MSRAAGAVAVAAAALLAACGGSDKPAPKASAASSAPAVNIVIDGTPTAGPSGAAGTGGSGTTAPGSSPGTTSAPGGGDVPGSSPADGTSATPSTAPSKTHIELDATLSKTCVRPGDSQTLTIKARPRMRVLVNTGYADGKEGSVHGGRFTDGSTDANGVYTVTWLVSPAAPPGEAATNTAAVDDFGTGTKRLPFRVAAVC